MSYPKRHHYLPQFYLEGFAEKGSLHVYDATLRQLRVQSPRNTGLERHLYRHENQEGDTTTIETELSAIEGTAKACIDSLDQRGVLTEEARSTLAEFVGLMLVRVPVFDEEFRELGDRLHKAAAKGIFSSEGAIKGIMERTKSPRGGQLTPAEFYEFIQQERYRVVPDKDQLIRSKMPVAAAFARALGSMQWLVTYSPKGQKFVTTDNPLTATYRPELPVSFLGKSGPTALDTMLLAPLSQSSCLVINSQGLTGSIRLSKRDAHQINLTLVRNCYRFVIGPEPGLVQQLADEAELPTIPRPQRARLLGLFSRTRK